MSSLSREEENIKVAVRIRPIQRNEIKDGDFSCVKPGIDGKEIQVKVGPLDAHVYRCNRCFPIDTTQQIFFNECGISSLLDSAIQGYRTCIFAFGQTGAGKTFTMIGYPRSTGLSVREKHEHTGLIGRSLEYLIHSLNSLKDSDNSTNKNHYSIKFSCTEIFNEQVFDLLSDDKERIPLAVREHNTDGFYLEGCKLIDCMMNYEVACSALDVAVKNRQTGTHDLNQRSSRSHCLIEIHIEIPVVNNNNVNGMIVNNLNDNSNANKSRSSSRSSNKNHYNDDINEAQVKDASYQQGQQQQYITKGKVTLVDLAGSERLKSTKSSGKVLQEAGFINKSLYVLGKVIAGLVRTNGDLNHKDVPYRDSKLTRLLIGSLGGRSRTLLISCVSEAKSSQAETLRTLKFRYATFYHS